MTIADVSIFGLGEQFDGDPGFCLDSVELLSSNIIRAWFSRHPDSSGAVKTNYAVVGDSTVVISYVVASATENYVDLHLNIALDPGTWTVTVSGVSAGVYPLVSPASQELEIADIAEDSVANGAVNSDSYELLKSFLNPAYRQKSNWDALIRGIAAGDALVADMAEKAGKQLFISSASGKYLEKRAGDKNISKPANVGLSDDDFRKLAISVINNKLTQEAFLEILELLYGVDSVRAYIQTKAEPFSLVDESKVRLVVDEKYVIDVVFDRSSFTSMRASTALELANVFTVAMKEAGVNGFAKEWLDPISNTTSVRIYSGSKGVGSSIRIVWGTADNALQLGDNLFPEPDSPPTMPEWEISAQSNGYAYLFTEDQDFYSYLDLQVGDYFVLTGVEFDADNRGSFVVTDIIYDSDTGKVETLEFYNPAAVDETVTQLEYASIQFFRPRKHTVYDDPNYTLVYQAGNTAYVSLAATATAVKRTPYNAAYLQEQLSYDITDLDRDDTGLVTLTTSSAHGISVGDRFRIEDFIPTLEDVPMVVGVGAAALDGDDAAEVTCNTSLNTVWSGDDSTYTGSLFTWTRDLDGGLWIIGGVQEDGTGWGTSNASISVMEIIGYVENANGSITRSYRWHQTDVSGLEAVGSAATVLTDTTRNGSVMVLGGYVTGPWADMAANNLGSTSRVFTKKATNPWLTAGTLAAGTPVAEHTLTAIVDGANDYCVVAGGIHYLNQATTDVKIYNQSTNTWAAGTSLPMPRAQHQAVLLDTNEILLVGGRNPASTQAGTDLSFSFWDFDEAWGATSFVGPVTVNRSSNTRVPGKIGYGVDLSTAAMVSTGGGTQTTLNANLLGDFTWVGWFTLENGCILRNGVVTPSTSADNTLFSFGIDPADGKFFIKYHYGTLTAVTIKTIATAAFICNDQTSTGAYPRYHHFAITKVVSGADAVWSLFINGELVKNDTQTKPASGTSGRWAFGEAEGAISRFQGGVDRVGYTTTALSQTDIYYIYRSEAGVMHSPGFDWDYVPAGKILNTCDILDKNGFLRRTGSMGYARYAPFICKLPDGRVLVAGGIGYQPRGHVDTTKTPRQLELKTAEIYDPHTGTWLPLPDMAETHSWCPGSSGTLSQNRVYVCGGFFSQKTEYLDLLSMTWHASDGAGNSSLGATTVHGGGDYVTSDESQFTIALVGGSSINPEVGEFQSNSLVQVLGPAGEFMVANEINGDHTALTGTSGTTLKFRTYLSNYTAGESGVVHPLKALPSVGVNGPYIFDVKEGFGLSATTGTIQTRLTKGVKYSTLELASGEALEFPDEEGWLLFNLGYKNQVGPVKYYGVLSGTILSLDPSFKFTATLEAGSKVTLLATRYPYQPGPNTDYSKFWATASSAGRLAAIQLIEDVSAAGIELDITTRFPGDRGLGGEGNGYTGDRISDIVGIYGGDNLDAELAKARDS